MMVLGINVIESETPPDLVTVTQDDGFFINTRFASDFRIRKAVYDRLKAARAALPAGYAFMVFEAFRPRSRQFELWNDVCARLRAEHPDIDGDALTELASHWVSNPHGFGSGHQAAAAVDITLCTVAGEELDMGTAVQEFNGRTLTAANDIPPDVKGRRLLLKNTLEGQGIVNYPDEWWHFSFGDRLWAEVTGCTSAFYAPID